MSLLTAAGSSRKGLGLSSNSGVLCDAPPVTQSSIRINMLSSGFMFPYVLLKGCLKDRKR